MGFDYCRFYQYVWILKESLEEQDEMEAKSVPPWKSKVASPMYCFIMAPYSMY